MRTGLFHFVLRYLRQRRLSHLVILTAVVAAVACSVGTQYGVKYLVDSLTGGPTHADNVWLAFVMLMSLIAADNFCGELRVGSRASHLWSDRRPQARHVSPSHRSCAKLFLERLPGMLTSRITATSNAIFTVENMFVWNVLPPCAATIAAITLIGTVSLPMAGALIVIAGGMVIAMFRWRRPANPYMTISPTRPPLSMAR